MRNLVVAIFVSMFSVVGATSNALAVVQTHDAASFEESVRNGIIQGKMLAADIRGWATVADTYWTAVKNTAKLPVQAVNKATAAYSRVTNIASRADRLLQSDAPMMQRLSAANSLIASTSRAPGSTIRNAEWWADRAQDQWEDNKELLEIENERQEAMTEALEFAASQGDVATGQMEMLQANHTTAIIAAKELQRINQQLETQWVHTLEQEAKDELKQAEKNRIHTMRKEMNIAW